MKEVRPTPPAETRVFRRPASLLLTFLALLAAVVAVYLPALNGGLLWDDDVHVTPPELRSVEGLSRIVLEPGTTQQYYPLTYSAFWLQHRLWGDSPLGYHLTNVLLHALSAWLLGLALVRLSVPGAWLAAWLFALHPVAVESVAWITEQKNTLSTALLLAALHLYLTFDERRGRNAYLLATGAFVLTLAAKSATVVLPAAILVLLWWRRGRLDPKRDVVPLLPWFALAAATAAVTVRIESGLVRVVSDEWTLGLLDRVLLAGRAVWFYLGKLVWPAELAFVYPRWKIDPSAAWQYLFPLAAVGLTVALWAVRGRWRAPLAAWLLYVGTLAPTLGFFDVYVFRYSFVADHFQYVASMSLFALAAAGLAGLAGRVPPRAAMGLAALLLAVLGAKSWREAFEYRGAETHYRAILAENPGAFLASNNLGLLLLGQERNAEAIELFENGLKQKPDSAELHHNLATALRAAGRNADAISHAERAIALKPSFAEAENNLGAALTDSGRAADAIPHLQRALELRPAYAEAENNLGVALGRLGRADEALARYESALRIDPGYAEAESNVGNLLLSLGRTDEAMRRFERALALKPGYAEAENGLGATLATLGRLDEARGHFEAALRSRPSYASAERNLGNLLVSLGQPSEALPHFESAARLQPESPEALADLALALSRANRLPEAVYRWQQAIALDPWNPDLRFNLAVALARAGLPKEARSALDETLRLKPDHARARGLLAGLAGRPG